MSLCFAKVQVLDDCGLCPETKRPLVRLHDSNNVRIVSLKTVGELKVIGIHPNPTQAARAHYLVMSWPRDRRTYAQMD